MKDNSESQWIDISVPLRDAMVHWPGDADVSIRLVEDMDKGSAYNLSMLSMGVHSGTHVDAPFHFISGAAGVDRIPLDALIGRARVIEIEDGGSIKPDELRRYRIRRGERIIFRTRNSSRAWRRKTFVQDYVFISDDAAGFLADRGVRLVGIDYLSVGSFKPGGTYVHKVLLGADVCILEGLDLSKVVPGRYDLICLPLRIAGADGAPARAVLRTVQTGQQRLIKYEL